MSVLRVAGRAAMALLVPTSIAAAFAALLYGSARAMIWVVFHP